MRLGVLADKVLNLGERELADTQQTLTRRNLVTERLANLGAAKGEAATVELEETLKVDKDALGSLGAEEARLVAGRSNLRRKHEVERKRVADRRAVRCLHPVLLQHGAKLFLRVRVGLGTHVRVLVPLSRVRRLSDQCVHRILKEVVSAVALLLLVTHHKVLELANVTRHVEHPVRGDRSTVNLKQRLANHKDVTPQLQQVLLDSTAGGAKVVEATDTTVDLKGGADEEASLQQVFARVTGHRKSLNRRITALGKFLRKLLDRRIDSLQFTNSLGKLGVCLGLPRILQLAHKRLERLELLLLLGEQFKRGTGHE